MPEKISPQSQSEMPEIDSSDVQVNVEDLDQLPPQEENAEQSGASGSVNISPASQAQYQFEVESTLGAGHVVSKEGAINTRYWLVSRDKASRFLMFPLIPK